MTKSATASLRRRRGSRRRRASACRGSRRSPSAARPCACCRRSSRRRGSSARAGRGRPCPCRRRSSRGSWRSAPERAAVSRRAVSAGRESQRVPGAASRGGESGGDRAWGRGSWVEPAGPGSRVRREVPIAPALARPRGTPGGVGGDTVEDSRQIPGRIGPGAARPRDFSGSPRAIARCARGNCSWSPMCTSTEARAGSRAETSARSSGPCARESTHRLPVICRQACRRPRLRVRRAAQRLPARHRPAISSRPCDGRRSSRSAGPRGGRATTAGRDRARPRPRRGPSPPRSGPRREGKTVEAVRSSATASTPTRTSWGPMRDSSATSPSGPTSRRSA